MIFPSQEVRDSYHRNVATELQAELADLEVRMAVQGLAVLIEQVSGSEVLIKVTRDIIGPAVSIED